MRLLPWRHGHRIDEAVAARKAAERELAETRAQTPFYKALGDSLREVRERNHLGEAIAHTFRGGNP